ncbi:MAG: cobaltochelatase subunit CobS, partial [Candidatus Puniceispirillaceae bacterium]
MSAETTHGQAAHSLSAPDTQVDVKEVFGLDIDLKV